MTCGCGKSTVWFDHTKKVWRGCECARVQGQIPK